MTAYTEFASTMFRGTLSAATGTVKFVLSAAAINAVNTINIANGSVTYSQFYSFSANVTHNHTLFTASGFVHDSLAMLELMTYSNRLGGIYVNGQGQNRHNAVRNVEPFPVIVVIPMSRGHYNVRLTANSSGHARGWLKMRYIRRTGG